MKVHLIVQNILPKKLSVLLLYIKLEIFLSTKFVVVVLKQFYQQ